MNLLLLGLIAVWQVRPGAPQPAPDGGGLLGGMFCCLGCPLITLVIALVPLVGVCKVFSKAGQPAWAALIPIYNTYVLCEIVRKPDWFIWTLIPCVNIYFGIMLTFEAAKAFGKESGFAIGMLLLPMVFWPILGFSDAEYVYGRGGRRRRRIEEEEEDEDEEDRPRRRRPRDEEEEEEERPRRRPRAEEDEDRPRRRPRDGDDEDDDDDRRRVRRRPRDDD
jgi:hypothetical protein